MEHREWLQSLGSIATDLKHVAPALIRDFAHQARTADASDLKEFAPAKRYTLLISLMQNAIARARDTVAGTVVKRIATIHKRAKNEMLERRIEQRTNRSNVCKKSMRSQRTAPAIPISPSCGGIVTTIVQCYFVQSARIESCGCYAGPIFDRDMERFA